MIKIFTLFSLLFSIAVVAQNDCDYKINVDTDEHPRASTQLEKLAQLNTPFRKNGTVTAGNASGINDGACVLLVASEDTRNSY